MKRLEDVVPEGLLVDRKWLKNKGFSRSSVDYYLRSDTLEAAAHGVYRRPGPPLKWQHVVYSLKTQGYSVHVGGYTALELLGYAHYLPLREDMKGILLYGVAELPAWLAKLNTPYRFVLRKPRLFKQLPEEALQSIPFGHWDWPIPCSTVELALLELLADVRSTADFDMADKYFESATSLRPGLLQLLLEHCRHVKVKRLFLWFSERHAYPWLKKLKTGDIDLGSGKRVVVQGGALNAKYRITVPREMSNGSEQSFF